MNSSFTSTTDDDYNHLYKIILIGDAGVGKTHLLNRYVKGTIPQQIVSTIGVEFATKIVTLPVGGKVKAQIWDTAGQERYRAITSAHYRKAAGALLVYDITKAKSFENVERWLAELKEQAESDVTTMIVGNKLDLVESSPEQRKVSKEEAKAFAAERGCLFEETSAVGDINVVDCFEKLLEGN
eukprot:TRINITY_DN7346_c0_g1_i3.p1 TRINITY_DN7346_c0_g1~~TRINITY_DN7346_c0_g1_i3.p1  ORF type:complete len:183 (+),score=51.52 TRINITY_DN7346_c0_g1_i3:221-769(+)